MAKEDYTAIPLDDTESSSRKANNGSAFNYDSTFDFRSISKFDKASFPSKSYFTFSKQTNFSKETAAGGGDDCLSVLVSGLLLFLVYSLTVMTLPVTGWWTVRRLDRWQRMVVFRLGKALPTRGPGWTLLLPALDTHQLVDLRNKSILVPPQQLITCDGAVVELGAELLYRVCDAPTFVGSCVDPQGALRSLTRTQMVNTLIGQELTTITRRGPEVEEAVLLTINGQIKDWGMEASSLKFSEVKVHKEAEHLSAVNPLLRQLGSMFGGSGSPLVAGQAPLSATSPLMAAAPPTDATPTPLVADPETSEALRAAVARLPAGPGATSLARGTYRIETTDPAGLYHVLIGDAGGEVREDAASGLTADVAVTLTAADLREMAAGRLGPGAAYSGGRLRLKGNVHLLMALGGLLGGVAGGQQR